MIEAAVKQRLCKVCSDALGAAGQGLGENSRLGNNGVGKEGSASSECFTDFVEMGIHIVLEL